MVMSVISSGRHDNVDESLSNTQKYVPLRQKLSKPVSKPEAAHQISSTLKHIVKNQASKHFELLQQEEQDKNYLSS